MSLIKKTVNALFFPGLFVLSACSTSGSPRPQAAERVPSGSTSAWPVLSCPFLDVLESEIDSYLVKYPDNGKLRATGGGDGYRKPIDQYRYAFGPNRGWDYSISMASELSQFLLFKKSRNQLPYEDDHSSAYGFVFVADYVGSLETVATDLQSGLEALQRMNDPRAPEWADFRSKLKLAQSALLSPVPMLFHIADAEGLNGRFDQYGFSKRIDCALLERMSKQGGARFSAGRFEQYATSFIRLREIAKAAQ